MIFNNELSALDNRGTARTRHCAPRGNPRKYVLGQSEVIVQGLTAQPCRRYAIASCRLFAGGSHRFFLTYVPSTFQATCLHRLLLPPPARLTLANTNQEKYSSSHVLQVLAFFQHLFVHHDSVLFLTLAYLLLCPHHVLLSTFFWFISLFHDGFNKQFLSKLWSSPFRPTWGRRRCPTRLTRRCGRQRV